MHAGIVQQFGTPDEVYRRPANLFVAGFIGSPPMNFLDGTLTETSGGLAFSSPDMTLPLPPLRDDVSQGRKVVLGVRPQDVELVADSEPNAARGRVWVVELLGSEKLVEVELGERRRITVQVRAATEVQIDDSVGVRLSPQWAPSAATPCAI
jgi:ABC-type sugar transport system ATPase subunit